MCAKFAFDTLYNIEPFAWWSVSILRECIVPGRFEEEAHFDEALESWLAQALVCLEDFTTLGWWNDCPYVIAVTT
jgi:hypothetical protein